MRFHLAAILLLACGAPAPADHECVISGDLHGSSSCSVMETTRSGPSTRLRIASEQGQPFVTAHVETVGGKASCTASVYWDEVTPRGTRLDAVFGSESCSVELTSTDPPHGTLTSLLRSHSQRSTVVLTASF